MMTKENYQTAKQSLMLAFNICAPSSKVQKTFALLVRDLERDRLSHEAKLKHMAGTLYDGLAYGNWIGEL